jgi:ATP-dependent DNA helicase RecQ
MPKKSLQGMVYQLVDQGLVTRTDGEKPILKLNDASWAVMRGTREVQLVRPKEQLAAKTASAEENWEGVDRGLFENLRQWRRGVATERKIPPFTVMHDTTLMELARVRPTTLDALRRIPGLGEKRLADFGTVLAARIAEYCGKQGVSTNQFKSPAPKSPIVRPSQSKSKNAARDAAFLMFQQQRTVGEAATVTGRAVGTVWQYLEEFIAERRPKSIDAWVAPAVYRRVSEAAAEAENGRLKPIYEKLGGEVPYEEIRLVIAHVRAQAESS